MLHSLLLAIYPTFAFILILLSSKASAVIMLKDFNNDIIELPPREQWQSFTSLHQIIIGILAKPSQKVETYYGITKASPITVRKALEQGSERLIFSSFQTSDWASIDYQLLAWMSFEKRKELLIKNDELINNNPNEKTLIQGQNMIFASMKHVAPGQLGFELFKRIFAWDGIYDIDFDSSTNGSKDVDDFTPSDSFVSISLEANEEYDLDALAKEEAIDECSRGILFARRVRKMLTFNSGDSSAKKEKTNPSERTAPSYAEVKMESKYSAIRFLSYAIQKIKEMSAFKKKSYCSLNAMLLVNSHKTYHHQQQNQHKKNTKDVSKKDEKKKSKKQSKKKEIKKSKKSSKKNKRENKKTYYFE